MANWYADDGSLINYEIYGNEPQQEVLVLIPSMLGSIRAEWRNFIKSLTADFRILTMDLRGHGRSQNASSDLMPERMMQDIIDLIDYLRIDTFHVAGYSLGGYLGLMLALHQPRRIATLLMHATKFYWTKEAAAKMRAQLDPDLMSEKVPAYADQLVQVHGARHWRVLVRQAADLVTFLVSNGITERMAANTQCPVLISVGDRDELVPLPEALRLSRVLPKGELLVLPNVRHPFNTIRPIPLLPAMQYFHKNANK